MVKNLYLATTLLSLLITSFFSASAAEVTISISPETFSIDRGARLSITITGNLDESPILEIPDGIKLRSYGTQQNSQWINGVSTQTLTQNYLVSAEKTGDYTFPSFEIKADGQTLKTNPVSFTVTASGQAPPKNPAAQQQNSPNNNPTIDTPVEELGFLHLDFSERESDHLYVGEMAPVRIKAFFPTQTRVAIRSVPRPEGPGFTLHNLSDQPEQKLEQFEGKTYRTVTWFAGISLAKAGEYPVTVSLDATVSVPDTSQPQRRRRRSGFGRSILDQFFDDPNLDEIFNQAFTPTIPREISLKSSADALKVKSLPLEGRPANFDGAVGSFKMEGYQLPAEATTGEPQKIRVTVFGSGNFDRLNAPKFEPQDSWKTYTPKTEFRSVGEAKFSGEKRFEFNAVPQKSGDMDIGLAFSYFDPNTETYHEVKSEVIPITVRGQNLIDTTGKFNAAPQPENTPTVNADTGLISVRPITGTSSTSLSPLIYSPLYWITMGLALLGIVGLYIWSLLKTRNQAPELVALRQSMQHEETAVNEVEQAIEKQDVSAFFESAQNALKQRLARMWGISPAAITLADLKQRLPADSPALEIFAKGDALAYSGGSAIQEEKLTRWQSVFDTAMNSLPEQK